MSVTWRALLPPCSCGRCALSAEWNAPFKARVAPSACGSTCRSHSPSSMFSASSLLICPSRLGSDLATTAFPFLSDAGALGAAVFCFFAAGDAKLGRNYLFQLNSSPTSAQIERVFACLCVYSRL